jgi:serine phosphatase RsbU (regulator of sigma subunit)
MKSMLPTGGAGKRRQYKPGDVIFSEGQSGAEMYYVLEGSVHITSQGRQIDALAEGSFFGEMSLIESHPRSANAIATTDCTLLVLDNESFLELIAQSPKFAVRIMGVISGRLRRLMAEEVHRQRMEEELKIARQIQLSLMPQQLPHLPGWQFAASCEPARQVGGDFFDFITTPDEPHLVRLVIADVTGKGVPAALFMASSHTTLRAQSLNGHEPAQTLARTNRVLLLDRDAPLLLSAFYATLDTQNGHLTFANAGHEPPLWWRAAEGRLQLLDQHNLMLGAFSDTSYEEWCMELGPGDSLVLYTDGVTEARNANGDFFGDERLHDTVAKHHHRSAPELLQAISSAVARFAGSVPPADDCTIVALKRAPT